MDTNKFNVSKNIQNWEEKIINIFPTSIPNRCEWTDEIDMLNILLTLSSKNLNNIYYPDGQVLNLYGADLSKEYGCIELFTEESIDIIKPTKLSFYKCEEDISWSYFRIETDNLESIFLENYKSTDKEELISLEVGEYIHIDNWYRGYFYDKKNEKRELNNKDELVNRYLNKSSFLIFAKESKFKKIYDNTFNILSENELLKKIEDTIIK